MLGFVSVISSAVVSLEEISLTVYVSFVTTLVTGLSMIAVSALYCRVFYLYINYERVQHQDVYIAVARYGLLSSMWSALCLTLIGVAFIAADNKPWVHAFHATLVGIPILLVAMKHRINATTRNA